jgi:subtilisin
MRGRLAILLTAISLVGLMVPAAGAAASGAAPGDRFVPAPAGAKVVPGSYIVVLSAGHPSEVAADHARAYNASVTHVYRTALRGYAARMSAQAAANVARDPRVSYVEEDQVVTAAHHRCGHGNTPPCEPPPEDGPTDPVVVEPASTQETPWGISRVGAPRANTGAGIAVYVIDTGIDRRHRDLNVSSVGFAAENCRGGGCQAAWDDDHGHGTHVAGTIGAKQNDVDVVGVAPGVTLHAVKVLAKSGSGSRSGVIAGIDWVAGHNRGTPRVANMSLGGSGSKSGTCTASGFNGTDAYHQALCNATRTGVVFAVAAGNSGANAANSVPAAYHDTVLTVSATTITSNWPSWSNWGNGTTAGIPTASAPVAIAAPGAGVLSTRLGGGTTTMSGTSMAAPHVAGAVALYLKANGSTPGTYTAFTNARSDLTGSRAQLTSVANGWSNTSGNPHVERFLQVGGL